MTKVIHGTLAKERANFSTLPNMHGIPGSQVEKLKFDHSCLFPCDMLAMIGYADRLKHLEITLDRQPWPGYVLRKMYTKLYVHKEWIETINVRSAMPNLSVSAVKLDLSQISNLKELEVTWPEVIGCHSHSRNEHARKTLETSGQLLDIMAPNLKRLHVTLCYSLFFLALENALHRKSEQFNSLDQQIIEASEGKRWDVEMALPCLVGLEERGTRVLVILGGSEIKLASLKRR